MSEIVKEIIIDFQPMPRNIMLHCIGLLKIGSRINDKAKIVINNFLSDASIWQGVTADRIKAELNEIAK